MLLNWSARVKLSSALGRTSVFPGEHCPAHHTPYILVLSLLQLYGAHEPGRAHDVKENGT